MIPRKAPRLCTITSPNAFAPLAASLPQSQQFRCLHKRAQPPVPKPTPFVPDAPTFLTLIGRNMIAHSSKIPDWTSLFSLTSEQLRDSGVEPARSRRYILRWREKFRNGEYGIGGDLTAVKDGAGELRIVSVRDPSRDGKADVLREEGTRRVVVNVGEGDVGEAVAKRFEDGEIRPVEGVRIRNWDTIAGKNVRILGDGRAEIRVQEGLWEHRRGRKVDGGERRKAEVRAKRAAAERKNA